jgi:hypothetical protein
MQLDEIVTTIEGAFTELGTLVGQLRAWHEEHAANPLPVSPRQAEDPPVDPARAVQVLADRWPGFTIWHDPGEYCAVQHGGNHLITDPDPESLSTQLGLQAWWGQRGLSGQISDRAARQAR